MVGTAARPESSAKNTAESMSKQGQDVTTPVRVSFQEHVAAVRPSLRPTLGTPVRQQPNRFAGQGSADSSDSFIARLEALTAKLEANIISSLDMRFNKIISEMKLQMGDVSLHIQEIEAEVRDLHRERDELWSAVVAQGQQIEELMKSATSRASTRANSTAASSAYTSVDDAPYPNASLCTFAVPMPEGVSEADKDSAKESVVQRVAEAADIPRSDIKDIRPLGAPVRKDNKILQSWKLIFRDSDTAFKTLRRKKQVRRQSGIRLEEDLTPEQRAAKEKRKWAFNHLQKKHDQLWVQWRFDELYINQTRELDTMRDENGDIIVTKRGFWVKLGEQDYQMLADEINEQQQRESARSEEREGTVGGDVGPPPPPPPA